jgi:hypothetical protein
VRLKCWRVCESAGEKGRGWNGAEPRMCIKANTATVTAAIGLKAVIRAIRINRNSRTIYREIRTITVAMVICSQPRSIRVY